MLRRRSVSWLFQPERSEHPMKSIAAKGLPSSRFIEQQGASLSIKQLEAFVKELNMTALQGWIVIGLLVLIMLGIVGIGAEIEALPWLWRTYNP